jgi:hypothetical protein
MSPQLQQILSQAQQLSKQDQSELIWQLSAGAQLTAEDSAEPTSWPEMIARMERDALASGQVKMVEGGLVVKGQPGEVLELDLMEFINQQREERVREVGGW